MSELKLRPPKEQKADSSHKERAMAQSSLWAGRPLQERKGKWRVASGKGGVAPSKLGANKGSQCAGLKSGLYTGSEMGSGEWQRGSGPFEARGKQGESMRRTKVRPSTPGQK